MECCVQVGGRLAGASRSHSEFSGTRNSVRNSVNGILHESLRNPILVLPANVARAVPHGQTTITIDGKSHLLRAVTSPYSPLANITGFPAMVLPVGATPEGLPIAVQLMAPPGRGPAAGCWPGP
jgi:Asp-tRNA(Asn)/Glu-tRNA(Gln) amidotransferase A subunit family amidase